MQWYIKVLKNYVNFQGRARRKEFWMFYLIHMLIILGLSIVETFIGSLGFIAGLYSIAIILPGLAVTARRLHDIGKSGWWMLISLIPFVGAIILIVFQCMDSVPDNEYGPNPKSGSASSVAV